uniref:Putative secreted peptide n=1 Tax=Anopheles braziliensis TaxID=58242 RepID=A0A2M3ZTD5_9DIPT
MSSALALCLSLYCASHLRKFLHPLPPLPGRSMVSAGAQRMVALGPALECGCAAMREDSSSRLADDFYRTVPLSLALYKYLTLQLSLFSWESLLLLHRDDDCCLLASPGQHRLLMFARARVPESEISLVFWGPRGLTAGLESERPTDREIQSRGRRSHNSNKNAHKYKHTHTPFCSFPGVCGGIRVAYAVDRARTHLLHPSQGAVVCWSGWLSANGERTP